jgi:hypothetical protein
MNKADLVIKRQISAVYLNRIINIIRESASTQSIRASWFREYAIAYEISNDLLIKELEKMSNLDYKFDSFLHRLIDWTYDSLTCDMIIKYYKECVQILYPEK